MSQPAILIIDDEEIMRDVISKLLTDEGYRVWTAVSGEEGLERLTEEPMDLVLLDLRLPGKGGLEILEEIGRLDPDIAVVMISAHASVDDAVQAIRLGADDFVTKPFRNEELLHVVKNGLRRRILEVENRQLKSRFAQQYSFQNLIGKSVPMQKVFDLIRLVARSRSTVLLVGESGTGKELAAKAIHACSPRADRPFVALNSGSTPTDLLESELFGHVKGAFTGAVATKRGLFEVADGGTLFLDEVGTLPLQTQSKLLRVLQEREFRRVGGLDNIKVDVRIIAATNIDLKAAVACGEFRGDLYYRLNVIAIPLPALRDRREDIPLLVDHFVHRFCEANDHPICTLDQEALQLLMEWDWPGNVRELENAIERSVVLAPQSGLITQDLFPSEIMDSPSVNLGRLHLGNNGSSLKDLVLSFEKELILSALNKADWNQRRAARFLRVKPSTLSEKLKRLSIPVPNHLRRTRWGTEGHFDEAGVDGLPIGEPHVGPLPEVLPIRDQLGR